MKEFQWRNLWEPLDFLLFSQAIGEKEAERIFRISSENHVNHALKSEFAIECDCAGKKYGEWTISLSIRYNRPEGRGLELQSNLRIEADICGQISIR